MIGAAPSRVVLSDRARTPPRPSSSVVEDRGAARGEGTSRTSTKYEDEDDGLLVRIPGDLSDEALIAEMGRRGWLCRRVPSVGWRTPSEFSTDLGYYESWLTRLLVRYRRQGQNLPGMEVQMGPSGKRVLLVRASAAFFDFLERNAGALSAKVRAVRASDAADLIGKAGKQERERV